MNSKNIVVGLIVLLAAAVAAYFFIPNASSYLPQFGAVQQLDATPQQTTLSGTYTCLPHLDTSGPQTQECAFGLKTDDGVYYAVNFGQSAGAMEQFQAGEHITAEGFVVIKEALSSDQWAKYNMKGIFTVTNIISPKPTVQAKIDINAVCEGALAYMTFTDGKAADAFVAECKEGKYPEVIEQYKVQIGAGDGKAI